MTGSNLMTEAFRGFSQSLKANVIYAVRKSEMGATLASFNIET
jgi:hypothetical protein